MNELDRQRAVINETDKEMARLFEIRMKAAAKIAGYKKERGLPVYDAEREAAIVAKNTENVSDPSLRGYYADFITHTMKVSRDYQTSLISGVSVAYSGVEGAFASIAARALFPQGRFFPQRDFEAAYKAVVDGDCEIAVLPVENSFAGEVGTVIDLIFSGPLYMNDTYELTVRQNLIGVPGATEDTVRKVISHPQALSQCAEYIRARGYETEEFSNTALAAKHVAALADPTVAAVGTVEAAQIYGLSVISRSINTGRDNTTRFAVLSRRENDGEHTGNKFFLVFSVKNQAGALAEAINIIGKHGYNMSALHSRPRKDLPWKYYFYIEGEGDVNSDEGRAMMDELSAVCSRLRLVGSYRGGADLV
jgi:chorismate mutase/prephenate dehydratase